MDYILNKKILVMRIFLQLKNENQKAKEIFESMNQFKIKHSSTNKQFITEKIIYKNNIDEYEH